MEAWITGIVSWTYFAAAVLAVITALIRKREPAAALGWSLAIVFLPFFGIILFILVGWNRFPSRLRRKISHKVGFSGPSFARDGGGEVAPSEVDRRWGPIAELLVGLGEGPRRGGNEVEVIPHGVVAFEEMEDAIRRARHHIHVEFFIFRDDELGRRATRALCERAREGVEVRVLVDGVGSRGNKRLLRDLREAGGEGLRFLPVRLFGKATPHLRNHRKIVIVDGRLAFFGGLNVGVEYLGRRRHRTRDWFDLHVKLEGPSVLDLQRMFLEDWDFAAGRHPTGDEYFPSPEPRGSAPAQVIGGGPDQAVNAVRQAYVAALARARRSIRIFTPYLVPDQTLCDALLLAARSGLRVQIITQFPPADHWVVQLCGEHVIGELLPAGVEVHGFTEGMMHAKAVVVDGEWAMIGSANLDNRSLWLNFEQMTIFDGPREVRAIDEAFEQLLPRCRAYTPEYLAARPLRRRLCSTVARLLAPIL